MNSPVAKVGEAATVATFLLLMLTCYSLAIFVMPAFLEIYSGAAWQLPLPARLAIAAGRPGILTGLFAIIMLFVWFRFRAPELLAVRLGIGSVVNLLLTLWFVGMTWVSLDFAGRLGDMDSGAIRRSTAPAAAPAAAPAPASAPADSVRAAPSRP